MAATEGQSSAPKPGLGDLEKELVCSVRQIFLESRCFQPMDIFVLEMAGKSGAIISTSDFTRLSTYILRVMFERMVLMASRTAAHFELSAPIHLSVLSSRYMVLQANPEHARSEQDKQEIAKKYKPGDSVLVSPEGSDADDEDRQLIDNVRQQSLAEVSRAHRRRASSGQAGETFSRRQTRSADNRERSDDERRSRHNNERITRRRAQQNVAMNAARAGITVGPDNDPARRIEHQSSLRSLLSASDVADTTQDEIVRLIMEEGMLDGIDLNGLDQAQEEELSDRLVQIFLSRHPERSRRGSEHTERPSAPSQQHRRSRSHTAQSRSPGSSTADAGRHPPVSRPHLLEANPTPLRHQRRASDETRRRRTSPTPVGPASTSETALRPAVRSSSDMTNNRPSVSLSQSRNRESSAASISRRSTEPESRPSDTWLSGTRDGSQQPQTARQALASLETSSPSAMAPTPRARSSSNGGLPGVPAIDTPGPSSSAPNLPLSTRRTAASRPTARQHPVRVPSTHYSEPSISYQGCPHYYGVGSIGEAIFNKRHHPATRSVAEQPHVLTSQRYKKPKEASLRGISDGKRMTNEDPAIRLEDGMFCDVCHSAASNCFWQCVTSPTEATSTGLATVPASLTSPGSTAYQVLAFSTECDICKYPIAPSSTRFHCLRCNEGNYDVCTNCYLKLVATGKISKENGHSGWRRCLNGHRMIVVGYEDHERGQRRAIVRDLVGGYTLKEESPQPSSRSDSQASVASPDLGVGDWSWKEGNTKRKKASRIRTSHTDTSSPAPDSSSPNTSQSPSSRRAPGPAFPPDGGLGLVLCASWSYFADENCTDELSFPRGAQITEAENINDEWYWGYYAGHTGLFPSNHCVLVREVT
ncbi:hypothetical protein PISL3812_00816 [Talaromyces islandicus]|uniref:SH3 domain-containing protein n=1 Tax=Talaromyces islandicus TaxID=28573 RepID=A0A0U1LKI6_TALIS|nr:hypothetical protein PISL3812_00816 [Talaromyces islandicus]